MCMPKVFDQTLTAAGRGIGIRDLLDVRGRRGGVAILELDVGSLEAGHRMGESGVDGESTTWFRSNAPLS